MKYANPRIEYAVPPTAEKRLDGIRALRMLFAQENERLRQRQAEIVALCHDLQTLRRDCELLGHTLRRTCREHVWTELQAELKKYNPDEPRVPAGNRAGGKWTTEGGRDSLTDRRVVSDATPDNSWIADAQYAANDPPVIDHYQGPPSDEPPEIPSQLAATKQAIYRFIKSAAYWLAEAGLVGEPAGDFVLALQAADWLSTFLPYVNAYLDPAAS